MEILNKELTHSDKSHEYSKKRLRKRSIKLTDYQKRLIDADDDMLKEILKEEIEKNIEYAMKELENLPSSEVVNKKMRKKNLIQRIKDYKKKLNDDEKLTIGITTFKKQQKKLQKNISRFNKNREKIAMIKVETRPRCLKCKKRGHKAQDCWEKAQDSSSSKDIICFNCGSKSHNIHACELPVDYSNLPYATCFICNSKGHISSRCPESDKGIYIRGGSCYCCNSKEHLAKNCPTKMLKFTDDISTTENTVSNSILDSIEDQSLRSVNLIGLKRDSVFEVPKKSLKPSKVSDNLKNQILGKCSEH